LATLTLLGAGTAAADVPLVQHIDDFKSGPFHQLMPALPADWGTFYQSTDDVLGGVRQVNLISDGALGSSSRIDIESNRMLVTGGVGSFFGAFLGYGYDASGNDGDMHANFDGYEYFQIDFERSDLGLVYLVEIWDGQGVVALLANTLTTEAQSAPFSAKLPLADFQGGDAEGNPQAIDWGDIRYLIVYFQSANASGGNDFSVTSIRAVDEG